MKEDNSFKEVRDKVENDFEISFLYITAGAIGLSVNFIDKFPFSSTEYYILLISSWIILALSLIIYLVFHQFTKLWITKTEKLFNENKELGLQKIENYNRLIDISNWTIISLTSIGIIFILSFITLNLPNMAQENKKDKGQNSSNQKFARNIQAPQSPVDKKPINESPKKEKN